MKSSLDLGQKALQEGRFQQAIAILEATTQVSPDSAEVWLALARAYRGADELPKAVAAYQFALNTRPADDVMAMAQQELDAIEHRSKAIIAEAMRPACEACGALLPAARAARPWCLCGWNTRTPPVIGRQVFLGDLFAYAANRGVVVSFKRREDVYWAAKHQLRLQGLGTKTYPVDARLALGVRERMAVLLADELRPVLPEGGTEALFRVRPLGQGSGPGRTLSWRQLVAHVSELDGTDVSMRSPDTSLAGVLVANGVLSPDASQQARRAKAPDESLGQALMRLGLATIEEILAGAVGTARLGPQPVRPVAHRLGEILIGADRLERRQLKQALFLQSQFQRPLGDLLVEARFATPGDVDEALALQPAAPEALPPADGLDELLVASKLLSRTQLINILAEMERGGVADLEGLLRERHLVSSDQLGSALSWQARKRALCQQGIERLGEILISQRAITSETLGQALMQQVDTERPIGKLLCEAGRITPEQLVAALEEQDRRRNRLAWRQEEDAAHGTRPLDATTSGAAALARATTRALTRVLVGDEVGQAGRAGPKGRLAGPAPWRLAALGVVATFALAIGVGIWAGKASSLAKKGAAPESGAAVGIQR